MLVSLMVLSSACVNPGVQPILPSPVSPLVTSTPPGSPVVVPTNTPPIISSEPPMGGTPIPQPGSPDPAAAIDAATNQLAAELGIVPQSIIVVNALPVQWNDSSLGCPQPGQVYLQVVTPGYLVTLSAEEKEYNVHTDLNGVAVVCAQEGDPVGEGTVRDPIVAEFIEQARNDLAGRLGISPQEIVLVKSEAVEWSNSSLGCPQEGEDYVQALTTGYRVVLAVGDVYFEYHTDQQRMILCEEPTE